MKNQLLQIAISKWREKIIKILFQWILTRLKNKLKYVCVCVCVCIGESLKNSKPHPNFRFVAHTSPPLNGWSHLPRNMSEIRIDFSSFIKSGSVLPHQKFFLLSVWGLERFQRQMIFEKVLSPQEEGCANFCTAAYSYFSLLLSLVINTT